MNDPQNTKANRQFRDKPFRQQLSPKLGSAIPNISHSAKLSGAKFFTFLDAIDADLCCSPVDGALLSRPQIVVELGEGFECTSSVGHLGERTLVWFSAQFLR
jgi:hypothetical protein